MLRTLSIHELIPTKWIPECEKGEAKITHFEITEERRRGWIMSSFSEIHRAPEVGKYMKLTVDGVLMMTDTIAEKRDHAEVVRAAHGRCLVMGLGLGMVANAMAIKPDVDKVTVIEKSQDVIDLVAPHMPQKVEVICADALTWVPEKGQTWDVIWHDIWPTISLDDLDERKLLKRRYGRRKTTSDGFNQAWAHDEIEKLQRQERNDGWRRW